MKNSLKLIHVPSFTVLSNWPPANSTLHHPHCLDFSPGGGLMAMGNAAGKEKQRRFVSNATGTKIFRCKNVDHSKGVERVLKVYMTNHPTNLVSPRYGRTSCKTSITLTDEYP
ncbi:hypothetical protein NC653_005447 [Populus alba x Populus x berolinensis]|nr:hypothetical protein NC653_005447 [Populus alba x Populus x berolinensis]